MFFNNNIFSPRVRKRKAYSTAFSVFLSYYWLHLKAKLFGKAYYEKQLSRLHLKNADKIKRRVQELQGLFIKFGQLISNLSNILPEEFRAPLEELQDHIKPKPYDTIEGTIRQELGRPPEEIFTTFEKKPLAAASIGQVHRATIGEKEVVVKIQHYNIDTIASADLQILKNLVKLHAFFMDFHGLDHTYEQVRQMIEEELDYRMEAESMQAIAASVAGEKELKVKIPEVFSDLNTKKILVTEFCEGTKIGDVATISSWDIDLNDVAKRLIELYCKMVLIDGFYHADPHPGNILVNKAGEIILLDFGAVARLSEQTKKAIPELIEAVLKNDNDGTVQALKALGFLGSDKASKKYVAHLVEIFRDFLQNEVEMDGMNFQNVQLNAGVSSIAKLMSKIDLRTVSNTIRIPKEYILLNRTLVLLMGNAFQLAPNLNIINVVRPYMKRHVLDKENGFTNMVVSTFKSQITTALSLPNDLSNFLKNADDGDIAHELKNVQSVLKKIYYLGQQFFYILILIGLAYSLQYFKANENGLMKILQWTSIGLVTFWLIRSIRKNWRIKL